MFNFEDYKGNYVMHCKTEEETEEFCEVMHNAGMKWSSGSSYLNMNYYEDYKERTCYEFNEGCFGSKEYFMSVDYKILEWSDFKEQEECMDKFDTQEINKFLLGFEK